MGSKIGLLYIFLDNRQNFCSPLILFFSILLGNNKKIIIVTTVSDAEDKR